MAKLTFKAVRDPHACCWCGKRFKDGPVGGVEATSMYDLEPKGKFVQIKLLSEEKIIGVIAEEEEAKKEGFDIFFFTCSYKCFHALRMALAQGGEFL